MKKFLILFILFTCQGLLFEYQTDIKKILFINKATKFLITKSIQNKETILIYIYQAAEQFHLCPDIVLSIAYVESKLNPYAYNKNKDGSIDYGIMQINNKHHRRIVDIKENIIYGTEYLYKCIKQHGFRGIYKYNGSKKYMQKVLKVYRDLKTFEK